MFDEKAQLHTLEGVTASIIILGVIIFAIEATSLTPLTASTANVHIETELYVLGQDILNILDKTEPGYESDLKEDISSWNGTMYIWNGSKYIESGSSDPNKNLTNNMTAVLEELLVKGAVSHNVRLTYLIRNDNITFPSPWIRMIYNGDPSNNAVIVSRKIVLHDGDINSTRYPLNPIKDIDPYSNLYNIVDVKLVLWRM